MRVTLAQLNPTIGAIDANAAAIDAAIESAERDGSDLVVTTELALIGYPPRDLLLRECVTTRCEETVRRLAARCTRVAALIGFPQPWPSGPRPARNAVALCRNGAVEAVYAKRLLPTYDVFDEDRYFTPGDESLVFECAGQRVGVLVCEDMWRSYDAGSVRRYLVDPVEECLAKGATMLAIPSASPFVAGKDAKHAERLAALAGRAHVVSVNEVGGNDDLIFDGRSRAYGKGRGLLARLDGFVAQTRTVALEAATLDDAPAQRFDESHAGARPGHSRLRGQDRATRGRSSASRAASDSALVATLGVMALGAANVSGILMPSRYSSRGSIDDALDLAQRARIAHVTARINDVHDAMATTFAERVRRRPIDRRREHAEPLARHDRDGGVEPGAGDARAHDRQQERIRGGLHDALRRHERLASRRSATC
jgi:predicted amidohydrolase